MYFPHNGLRLRPIGSLYANKRIPSIYSRHIALLVESSIGAAFSVSSNEMRFGRERCGNVTLARHVAMYLAHVVGGLSMSEVSRLFGRDRTTVAHACARLEDRRDDAVFDRSLDFLELGLTAALRLHEGDAR
jgi:hypothetical protein